MMRRSKSCFFYLLAAATTSFSSSSYASKEVGNGGDMCEAQFNVIRDDIAFWLINGGGAGLTLPAYLSRTQYETDMRSKITEALVSCTDEPVMIGESEKTCKNFVDPQGQARITCNVERLTRMKESDLYPLVHHEYAGLAGIEVNETEESQYPISNQISEYLEDQVVKRLAVKPSPSQYLIAGISCACAEDLVDTQSKPRWHADGKHPYGSMYVPTGIPSLDAWFEKGVGLHGIPCLGNLGDCRMDFYHQQYEVKVEKYRCEFFQSAEQVIFFNKGEKRQIIFNGTSHRLGWLESPDPNGNRFEWFYFANDDDSDSHTFSVSPDMKDRRTNGTWGCTYHVNSGFLQNHDYKEVTVENRN